MFTKYTNFVFFFFSILNVQWQTETFYTLWAREEAVQKALNIRNVYMAMVYYNSYSPFNIYYLIALYIVLD